MAEFNPDTAGFNPDNMTGRSQGVDSFNFRELFNGLAGTIGGVVQAEDNRIKTNIKDDVSSVFDATNAVYGYDENAATGTVPNLDSIPAELKDTRDTFSTMVQARAAGKLSEAHYWALLNKSVKEVRAKYPGYYEEIDAIYSEVTGAKPALALRNALQNEYDAELRSASSSADDAEKRLFQYAPEIATLFPDFFSDRAKYAGREAEILNAGIRVKAQREQVTAENNELNLLSSQNNLNKGRAKDTYAGRANQVISTALNSATNAMGFSTNNFMAEVGNLLRTGPTPDAVVRLRADIATLRANVQQEFLKIDAEPWAQTIDPVERKQAREAALSQLDWLDNMIENDQAGLAAWYANMNKMIQDKNLTTVRELAPDTAVVETLNKVSPALADSFILQNGGAQGVIGGITSSMLITAASGKKSIGDILEGLNVEKSISEAERDQIATSFLTQLTTSFSSNSMSDQTVRDFVAANFMGDSPSINKVWTVVNGESKLPIYNKLTSPAIADRIAKTNDPMIMNAYAAWVKDQFESIPQVRATMGEMVNPVTTSMMQVQVNPNTMQLEIIPKGTSGGPNDFNTLNQRIVVERERKKLATINLALSNMKYALEKAGVDPGPIVQEIMGRNGVIVPDAKEGTESGNAPLDQSGGILLDDKVKLASYTPEEDLTVDLAGLSETDPVENADGELDVEAMFDGVLKAGPGYTVVRRPDGTTETREGARNWRNNNPGNIEYGKFALAYGAVGTDGRFAVFPSYEAGRKAKEALLFESKNYKNKTIAQAIARYAPSFENDTNAYTNAVASAIGVPTSTPLQDLTPEQRQLMLDAMQRVEGWKEGKVIVE